MIRCVVIPRPLLDQDDARSPCDREPVLKDRGWLLAPGRRRNTAKVYGSPMYDLVVARHGLAPQLTGAPEEAAHRLAAVLHRLRDAFPPAASVNTATQTSPQTAPGGE